MSKASVAWGTHIHGMGWDGNIRTWTKSTASFFLPWGIGIGIVPCPARTALKPSMTGTPPSPPPPPLLGSKPGDEQLSMTSINVECFGDEPLPLTLHLLTQQPMPIVISSTRALSRCVCVCACVCACVVVLGSGLELELELPHHHPSSTRTDAHPFSTRTWPGLASPRAQPSIRGTGQVGFGIQSTAFIPVYLSGRVCPSRPPREAGLAQAPIGGLGKLFRLRARQIRRGRSNGIPWKWSRSDARASSYTSPSLTWSLDINLIPSPVAKSCISILSNNNYPLVQKQKLFQVSQTPRLLVMLTVAE
ncbi:hypothetical protein FALCPG4_19046 [Fusarium falciforme]